MSITVQSSPDIQVSVISPNSIDVTIAQGAAGDDGADGLGFNWTGAWDSGTAYVAYDVAESGGSSYVCILGHTNQLPPNATYWELLASKGNTGNTGSTGSPGPTAVSEDAGNRASLGGDSLLFVGSMGLREPPTIWTSDALLAMPTGWKVIRFIAVAGGGGGGSTQNTNSRCAGGGGGGGTVVAWMDQAAYAEAQADLLALYPTADNWRLQISVAQPAAGGTGTANGTNGQNTSIELAAYNGGSRLGGLQLARAYGGKGGQKSADVDLSGGAGAGGGGEFYAECAGVIIYGTPGAFGGSTAALTTHGGSSAFGGGAVSGSYPGDGVDATGYGGGGSGGARDSAPSRDGGDGGPGIAWMEISD